jgi:hypothetical protein
MSKTVSKKIITEPARQTSICREADVVVIGGGPGGFASAIAASRSGAKTVLLERYGHLGGMATGGLINIIPNLSDISGEQYVFGLTQEIIDRLSARGGASYPKKKDWGTTDRRLVDYYSDALRWFYVRNDPNIGDKERLLYSAVVDPEIFKDELNIMVQEAGVDLLLHSWVTEPIVENDAVKGIIFESKSGRQAILGKVIIDSTGDGDIFVAAGAEYDGKLSPETRGAWLAFVFWVTNINLKKADDFKRSRPAKFKELMEELAALGGYPFYFKSTLKNQPNTIWYHSFQMRPDGIPSDAKDVEELTRVDVSARRRALVTYEFMKKNVPGFEKSFIMLSAPQLGLQGGRRVIGEYTLNPADMETDKIHEDTIAVLPNNDNDEISARHPVLCIPYRCLVPRKIDNLLVACRAFSSEDGMNQFFNIIPFCISYGQAAGTAAAMAVKAGIQPRKVDYVALRANLVKQGVRLPDIKEKILNTKS